MTRRILAVYDQATAADAAEGARWYQLAHELAAALAAGTQLAPEDAAGVLAALSPRCGWPANVAGAAAMVEAASTGAAEPTTAGTARNRAKAWRIANGEPPEDVLRGPKVCAFYRAICGEAEAVTVDVWTARAAEGARNKNAPTGRRYERIAAAYRRAADLRGIAPRDMQATVWVAYRRAEGVRA